MFFERIAKAPDFPNRFKWLNTQEPLSLEKLRGHVIVLDFWTYCCINCMHILPDLEKIEEKYKNKPVVVIGVHSAKFEEESESKNIQQAISRYEIKHPVIVDEKMQIWNSYNVNGWPTIVVIDPLGNIIYDKSGEGQLNSLVDVIDILLEHHTEKQTLVGKKIEIRQNKIENKSILSYPGKLAFSPDKKYFALADSNHNRIIISDIGGKIQKIIGNGKKGFKDGDFEKSEFNRPQGVLFLENKIFVADTENNALRLIDLEKGKIETRASDLSSPWDLAEFKNKLYIAMAGTHQIWSYNLQSDKAGPFAGSGFENIVDGPLYSAQFAQPSGITLLNDCLYVADSEVSGIRKIGIKNNYVSTISGKGLFVFGLKDGKAKDSLFQHPLGICSDGKNILYVADTYNNSIREINLDENKVSTLIKKMDLNVCMVADEECNILGLWEPSDVKYLDGKLYITDTNNHLVRVFDLDKKKLEDLNIRI